MKLLLLYENSTVGASWIGPWHPSVISIPDYYIRGVPGAASVISTPNYHIHSYAIHYLPVLNKIDSIILVNSGFKIRFQNQKSQLNWNLPKGLNEF